MGTMGTATFEIADQYAGGDYRPILELVWGSNGMELPDLVIEVISGIEGLTVEDAIQELIREMSACSSFRIKAIDQKHVSGSGPLDVKVRFGYCEEKEVNVCSVVVLEAYDLTTETISEGRQTLYSVEYGYPLPEVG